jgi:hypothetical protein
MVVVAFFMVVVARLSLSIASHQLVPSHVVSIFDVETAYYVVCFPDQRQNLVPLASKHYCSR